MGGDGYGALHELGNIVALHKLTMIVGVGTGQLKGLALAAIAVYMGKEGAGVVAIVAARAEHYPAAVAAPRVIALGVGRVEGNG